MEELKLERISDRQLEDIENKYPRKYRIAQTTANAQLKADQQVLTIVVDKLKAEITRLKEENTKLKADFDQLYKDSERS